MTTPLFLDKVHKLTFEKVAMPVRLSESPESWQRDIASEVYKQLPFIGDYAVNVILDRVDAQRGYGFGSAHISNKTDAPMQDRSEMPSVRIPIVIRDYIMSPLDVFMDESGVYPLSESRLRERLFRTDSVELSTRRPSDKGLTDQLYPPMRSNYGSGSLSGAGDAMGMGKVANAAEAARRSAVARMKAEASANPEHIGVEKGASLLDAIASTITERQADEFVDTITTDPALKLAVARNPAFEKLAMTIAGAPRIGVEKTAQALVDAIKPTVVQLVKLASGRFLVKWANAGAFAPQEDQVDGEAASRMAGTDLSGMKPGASITLSTEKAQKSSLEEPVYVQISEFGKYEVKDADSNSPHFGWVVPVVDFEMQPLELFIFVSPQKGPGFSGGTEEPTVQTSPGEQSVWSVQDEIAGKTAGGSEEEFFTEYGETDFHPQGSGAFVSVIGKRALLPMTIQHMQQGPDGAEQFVGETLYGEPVTLQKVDSLKAVTPMGEGSYGIPADLVWLPLPGDPVFLAKTPEDIQNVEQAQQLPNQVQVGSTGQGEFSMDGPPLAKVAKEQKQFITKTAAEFMLVAMGVNPFVARDALGRAELGSKVKLAGREIVPLSYLHSQMTKKAHETLKDFPRDLRQNLVKEAAVINDADTADKVLSMNFLNPDNISTFARYLPEIDQSSKKLAEMLVATRLGMGGPDETAIERSMIGLERVIDGLKSLQQNSSESD